MSLDSVIVPIIDKVLTKYGLTSDVTAASAGVEVRNSALQRVCIR